MIMPNHIHGILMMVENGGNRGNEIVKNNQIAPSIVPSGVKDGAHVGAKNVSPLHGGHDPEYSAGKTAVNRSICHGGVFRPQGTSKTIGSVVRGFKIGVTKWMRQNAGIYHVWNFKWPAFLMRNRNQFRI